MNGLKGRISLLEFSQHHHHIIKVVPDFIANKNFYFLNKSSYLSWIKYLITVWVRYLHSVSLSHALDTESSLAIIPVTWINEYKCCNWRTTRKVTTDNCDALTWYAADMGLLLWTEYPYFNLEKLNMIKYKQTIRDPSCGYFTL